MIWEKLLDNKRFRLRGKQNPNDARSPFEDDISRIIFSSAFRRLQDKTQVFPLERDSLVRTRLTHSMEVSNIGRSIGLSIEGKLLEKKKIDEKFKGYIPSIIAAAGLVHDLGNPAFGHYGEDAFQSFYSEKSDWMKSNGLNDDQIKDLTKFDGNVQTFRYLTKLQFLKDDLSYNLSFPTLATVVKYPFSSRDGNIKKDPNVCIRKYGFFQSEKDKFQDIWQHLGITTNARYPLTYVLEAADDIAYSANDLEDGVRKCIINSGTFLNKLENYINENNISDDDLLKVVYNKCIEIKKKDEAGIENCIIELFRIEAHSKMIEATVEAFIEDENYNKIMEGTFNSELLEKSKAKNIRKFFSDFAHKDVFSNKDVLKLELMGEEVIKGLLNKFFIIVDVDVDVDTEKLKETKSKAGKMYNLISDNYRFIHEKYSDKSKIDRIQLINDYICGMTDSYALQTYRKLAGIEL